MPTREQAIKAVILCQYLSNGYQPLYFFRYDPKRKEIFVIAGATEEIEYIIYPDGNWRFTDEQTEF
jgi:hypothetical protein